MHLHGISQVDYFWRVEPDVHFYCDMPYDPFQYMRQQCASYAPPLLQRAWTLDPKFLCTSAPAPDNHLPSMQCM